MRRIRLHRGQVEIFRALMVDRTVRHGVADCCRGFGKSYVACAVASTMVHELLALGEWVPNKTVWIIAPTYDQVTDIYFPILANDFGLEDLAIKSSRDLGRFYFDGNVELRLLSYEAIQRMRGKGAYGVVWDEIASCKKNMTPRKAWETVIEPCMRTRWSPRHAAAYGAVSPARALFIGTPIGYDDFYYFFNMRERDASWASWQFDYTQAPLLDVEDIERLKGTMDPIEFAREYGASFKESGNSVFYCFDRGVHVRNDLPYFAPPRWRSEEGPLTPDEKPLEMGEDVHVGIDFNVGLMCSTFFAERGSETHYIDEMKGYPDTESLAVAITTRFRGHRIHAYPDPTGRARKSSAPVGRTDFAILEAYGIRCYARQGSPPIVDSAKAVNQRLATADGRVSMYVSADCQGTIESLERTRWLESPDSAAIDKSDGVEHYSDGIRYAMEYRHPVRAGKAVAARGFNF